MQKRMQQQANGFSQNGPEDSSQGNPPSQNPLTQMGSWGGAYSQPGGALSSFSQTGLSQMEFSQDSVIGGAGAGGAAYPGGLLSQDSTYHGERLLSDNGGFLSQMWSCFLLRLLLPRDVPGVEKVEEADEEKASSRDDDEFAFPSNQQQRLLFLCVLFCKLKELLGLEK